MPSTAAVGSAFVLKVVRVLGCVNGEIFTAAALGVLNVLPPSVDFTNQIART
jgi:hypothetical protein